MSQLTDISTQDRFLTILEVRSPGKVILYGEHSVVYGKLAIAASINQQTSFSLNEHQAETCDISCIHLNMSTINLQLEINCNDFFRDVGEDLPLLSQSRPTNYNFFEPENIDFDVITNKIKMYVDKVHKEIQDSSQRNALLAFLYLYTGMSHPVKQYLKLSSFEIMIETDLPIGAGLGSSASFAVATAAGFFKLVRAKQHHDKDCKDLSYEDKDVISRWAFQAERVMHGTPSGLDNMICTFGGLVKFRKAEQPQQLRIDPSNLPLECFLIDTEVPKNTRVQIEKVTRLKGEFPLMVEKILDAMEEVVLNAVECLERLVDDSGVVYGKLNSLVDVNHCLLKALGVSHPEIEGIVGHLAEFGLHAKLTGAGGGGYVLCLLPRSYDDNVFEKVKANVNGARLKLGAEGVYCQFLDLKRV